MKASEFFAWLMALAFVLLLWVHCESMTTVQRDIRPPRDLRGVDWTKLDEAEGYGMSDDFHADKAPGFCERIDNANKKLLEEVFRQGTELERLRAENTELKKKSYFDEQWEQWTDEQRAAFGLEKLKLDLSETEAERDELREQVRRLQVMLGVLEGGIDEEESRTIIDPHEWDNELEANVAAGRRIIEGESE